MGDTTNTPDDIDAPEEDVWVAGRGKARAKALLAAAKENGYESSVVRAQLGGYYVPTGALVGYVDPDPDDVAEPVVDDEALRLAAQAEADEAKAKADAEAAEKQAELDKQAEVEKAAEAEKAAAAEKQAEADKQAAADLAAKEADEAKFAEEKAALDGVDPLPEPKGNGSLADWIAFSAQRAKIAGKPFDAQEAETGGRDALREKYGTKA